MKTSPSERPHPSSSKSIAHLGLTILLLSFAIALQAAPQRRSHLAAEAKYSDALDLVFALDLKECRGARYLVTLRFLPSFRQESQIILCQQLSDEVAVFQQILPAAEGSVWKVIASEGEAQKRRTATEVASFFHAQTKVCKIDPALARQWMQELLPLPLAPSQYTGNLMGDGILYELIIEAGINKTFVHLQGLRDRDPVISWMQKVQKSVEAADASLMKGPQ